MFKQIGTFLVESLNLSFVYFPFYLKCARPHPRLFCILQNLHKFMIIFYFISFLNFLCFLSWPLQYEFRLQTQYQIPLLSRKWLCILDHLNVGKFSHVLWNNCWVHRFPNGEMSNQILVFLIETQKMLYGQQNNDQQCVEQ